MLSRLGAPALALLLTAAAPAGARTVGTLEFTPCELESRNGGSVEAACARFEVPEDPAQPQGRRIALQLALVPARAQEPEPDLVVLLAGGPGQSALEAYGEVAAAFEPLARHRHILLLDQRGTGKSNPLRCALPDWKDPAEQTPAALRRQTAECLAALGERADPRFYTTRDAVRDLEAVRQALGAPRFNLVGVSYGTRVALEYLRRHPDGVRTVALDSAVPPELALLQDHARNLDDALARMFAACRNDALCAKRFGDPLLTLKALRAQLGSASVTARINDPLTHEPRDEVLSDTLVTAIVRLYAYQPEAAALLPLLLHEAEQGRPQALIAQGELVFRRLSESLAHGMELSVVCAEDAPFLRARPEDAGTVIGTALVELLQEQCALWPRGAIAPDFKQPVVSDRPVLLVAGELDPVTPPRYAEHVARALSRSRVLVVPGQGHSVLARGCLPKVLRQFVEQGDGVALDVGCVSAMGALPAFTSFQGPEP
jgi:pimeloyl-ACP methyl ester carboxylesterase